LSQGFPGFSPPPALLERITHHLNHGDNQYPPMAGVLALRFCFAKDDDTLRSAVEKLVAL